MSNAVSSSTTHLRVCGVPVMDCRPLMAITFLLSVRRCSYTERRLRQLPPACGRTPADHCICAPFGGKAVLRRESAHISSPHLRHPARAPLSLPLGPVQGIFGDPTAARLSSEARPLFPLSPAHPASMHSPPLLLLFWGEQFADVLHRGDAVKAELSLFVGDILEHVFHFR